MIQKFNSRRAMYEAVFPPRGVGAELGVQFAGNVADLVASCQPKKLYLVDPWEVQDGSYEAAQRIAAEHRQAKMIRQWDHEWIPTVPDKSLDWVYVDTLHSYDHTILELELLRPKVKSIIAGHDLVCSARHDAAYADDWGAGVMLALMETLSQGWLELIAITTVSPESSPLDNYPSWACRVKEST
ncbi:MAG: class I SAM-dependent methyltransferase [Pirellulaceae bacterium]